MGHILVALNACVHHSQQQNSKFVNIIDHGWLCSRLIRVTSNVKVILAHWYTILFFFVANLLVHGILCCTILYYRSMLLYFCNLMHSKFPVHDATVCWRLNWERLLSTTQFCFNWLNFIHVICFFSLLVPEISVDEVCCKYRDITFTEAVMQLYLAVCLFADVLQQTVVEGFQWNCEIFWVNSCCGSDEIVNFWERDSHVWVGLHLMEVSALESALLVA